MVQSHGTPSQHQPPKLLKQVCEAIRARHYSLRTEDTYLRWIKRFILFHGKRHPRDMGVQEVQQFLSHLAVAGHVAASTQSQALSAILFLYRQVLKQDIGWLDEVVRAKQPHRVPVVLTQDEVAAVLRHLSGTPWIMATLLYGAGLRLMECIRLRVKDVDFAYNQIVARDGKAAASTRARRAQGQSPPHPHPRVAGRCNQGQGATPAHPGLQPRTQRARADVSARRGCGR